MAARRRWWNQSGRPEKAVFVEAYSFTSRRIATALIDAKRRGVDVEVILDKSESNARGSDAGMIAAAGIPSFTTEGGVIPHSSHSGCRFGYQPKGQSDMIPKRGIGHSKVMIIDGVKVITGSFNFTRSAEEYNLENLLVISNDPQLADAYTTIWKRNLAQSKPYSPMTGHTQSHRRMGLF